MVSVLEGIMRRAYLVLSGALVLATAALAQSGGGTAIDPITGIWTGSVGPGASPGYTITLNLRFDGTSAVTGTAQGAGANDKGVVKKGTFDPKTGALKLEVAIDDGAGIATFEGWLVLDTATGRLSISNQPDPGTFILKKGAASAGSAAAQSSSEEATAVRAGFTELSGWILKSAELIPADRYTYQPVKTVRTVGQQIAHIIDGQNYYCGRASGQKVEWLDTTEKGATDKATLLPRLKQSMQTCAALYGGAFRAPLLANIGHASLHYGNLVTYMRMLGLKPPSS
jgi:hypothetical protein